MSPYSTLGSIKQLLPRWYVSPSFLRKSLAFPVLISPVSLFVHHDGERSRVTVRFTCFSQEQNFMTPGKMTKNVISEQLLDDLDRN